MKKYLAVTALAVASLSLGGCSHYIQPGYVGIEVDRYGSDAGVQTKTIPGGTSVWAGVGKSFYEYPTHTKTYTFSAAAGEGKPNNEEILFQDSQAIQIATDITVSYHADPSLAARLFVKYRESMDDIVSTQLRMELRNAFVTTANGMTVDQIYGPKKMELLASAKRFMQKKFAADGLIIDDLSYAGNIRPPQAILDQINERAAAEQKQKTASFNAAASTAQSAARTAEAQADADVQMIRAKAAAETTKLQAAAISASPSIVEMRRIEMLEKKWNGQLPPTTVVCSSTTCPGAMGLGGIK